MRKILIIALFIGILTSCSKNDRGELVGVKANKFFSDKPQGMVLIPSGSFTMGPSNPNVLLDQNPTLRTVSVKAFYMDETEITNSEYRQFINWVRDSVVRTELAGLAYEKLDDGQTSWNDLDQDDPLYEYYPIPEYIPSDDDEDAYMQYLENNDNGTRDVNGIDIFDKTTFRLNWDAPLYYELDEYSNAESADYIAVLEGGLGQDATGIYENLPNKDETRNQSGIDRNGDGKIDQDDDYNKFKANEVVGYTGFFIPAKDTPNELRAFKTDRIVYSYREFDKESAKWSEYKQIEVYPDTTVWYKDFSFSYNEPMHNDYFWHDAYAEYPVVGVSWEQAQAFAHWRTFYKNQHKRKAKKNIQLVSDFRLPTETEWEYAARGGLERAEYPWGGPYTYDDKGCFLANFKPERGDYIADQILYTAEAESYWPNDYGLYNMSGNVSEWTDSNFNKAANDFVSSLNPNVEGTDQNKRKVVRGGSWKDVAHFLKVSTRDYEFQNKKRSYIGFRTVQSYMGEDVGFQENPNKIF